MEVQEQFRCKFEMFALTVSEIIFVESSMLKLGHKLRCLGHLCHDLSRSLSV